MIGGVAQRPHESMACMANQGCKVSAHSRAAQVVTLVANKRKSKKAKTIVNGITEKRDEGIQ